MDEVRLLGDGEFRVGATAVVRQPGLPERTWTVTELTPGRSFTWTSDGRGPHFVAPIATLLSGRKVRELVDTEAASLTTWCQDHR